MPRPRWTFALALLALAAAAAFVRIDATSVVLDEQGAFLRDNDTIRRLEFMRHVDRASEYPSPNPNDGYPQGTVMHWTLPMNWAISLLDGVFGGSGRLQPNEAGAIWAGVVYGTLAVVALAMLAAKLFGSYLVGVLCGALFGFMSLTITGSAHGNGDHQSLQSLCCITAIGALLIALAGRGGRSFWVLAGLALGLANWVTAESMVLLQLFAVAGFVHVLLATNDERRAALPGHALWSGAALAVVVLGDFVEHGAWPTLEWDRVSMFQGWQLLVFVAFLGGVRLLAGAGWMPAGRFALPTISAVVAVVVGLLPLLVPAVGAAMGRQIEFFSASNAWVQAEVEEYTALLFDRGVFVPGMIGSRLGYQNYLLPLFVWGVIASPRLGAARWPLALFGVGLFGLTLLEVKLGHLFLITSPLLFVAGGSYWLERFEGESTAMVRATTRLLGGLVVVLPLFAMLPPGEPILSKGDKAQRELFRTLADLHGKLPAADPNRGVLAPWSDGAGFLYYSGVPTVASGYHRNLAGIHDSWRALTSLSWPETEKVLRARKVRFVVSMTQPEVLLDVQESMPELGKFAGRVVPVVHPDGGISRNIGWLPRATNCLWWRLMHDPRSDARFRIVYRSQLTVPLPGPQGMKEYPLYSIWRVVYPEEDR